MCNQAPPWDFSISFRMCDTTVEKFIEFILMAHKYKSDSALIYSYSSDNDSKYS